MARTLSHRVPPLRESGAEAPAELEAIVGALLDPDPDKRIADAALLARELTRMASLWNWSWTVPDVDLVRSVSREGRAASGVYHAQLLATQGAATRPA
jgi:hypothetical protein